METPKGAAHAEGEGGRAYLFMLLSSLAFASMGAFSHLAGERCDWHIVAVARSSLAFVFTLTLSLLPACGSYSSARPCSGCGASRGASACSSPSTR